MKPIIYTAAQIPFMVKAAMFLNPGFSVAGQSEAQLRLTACGRKKPSPSVLTKLNLIQTSGGYLWQTK